MTRRLFSSTGLAILLASAEPTLAAPKAAQAPIPPVLTAMQEELDRSMAAMSKSEPPAYFISYTVADRQYAEVSGSNGAVMSSTDTNGALAGSADASGYLPTGRHA